MLSLFTPSRCLSLTDSDLLQPRPHERCQEEQIEHSYRCARAVAAKYSLSADDVLNLTDKFWEMHMDNVVTTNGATITLLTIQYNLAAGTIAPFARKRADLRPLLRRILSFDVSAQFLLTEIGHGLDAMHLETTATWLPNGDFDLHTPSERAAKHMPPTGPFGGVPKVAVVFARLIVQGENRGIRPFIVAIGDGKEMCEGVSCRILPRRAGSKAVDHALTYFSHVRLPASALLGNLDKPADERLMFLKCIWRVTVGSLALATCSVPCVSVGTVIAARYSLRRTVTGGKGQQTPIWSFRTQQLPILHSLAKAYVMKAHALEAIQMFLDPELDIRVRMGVAATLKASMLQNCQKSLISVSERLGAHGLYEHNGIIATQLEMRGVGIAEGDVLALSIRLATELFLERYDLPESRYPDCLLARHEAGLLSECRSLLAKLDSHRGEAFNRLILPLCQPVVEAIGHRMAYEAALDAGVDKALLDMYEIDVVKSDAAWYVEHAGLSRWKQHETEESAASTVLPFMEQYLRGLHADSFALAPIVTQEKYDSFIQGLTCFDGHAQMDLFPSDPAEGPGRRTPRDEPLARL